MLTPSCATTSCGWATLASVTAAPSFLRHTPACHPIRIASIAIVRERRGLTTTCCWWAAFSMHLAAPRLLANRPASNPVCESIRAVIRICWPHWLRRQSWQHWHNDWGSGGHLRRTAPVVNPAAPGLLFWRPCGLGIDGTVERIAGWHWSWSNRWGRSWCWCGEWCWWHSGRRLWTSCGGPGCATSANCGAAIVLLLHRPQGLPIPKPLLAIKWQ